MKIGIIGLPQSGKKSLFYLLTSEDVSEKSFAGAAEIKRGTAQIKDPRFDKLTQLVDADLVYPADFAIELIPRFDQESITHGDFLTALDSCDVLCHLIRCFPYDFNPESKPLDPSESIERVYEELLLADKVLVDRWLEKLKRESTASLQRTTHNQQKDILLKIKAHLQSNEPLATLPLEIKERQLIRQFKFLSQTPLITIINVHEEVRFSQQEIDDLAKKFKHCHKYMLQAPVKAESELALLDDDGRDAFLDALDLESSILQHLPLICFSVIGLQSVFILMDDEVRTVVCSQGLTLGELFQQTGLSDKYAAQITSFDQVREFPNYQSFWHSQPLVRKGLEEQLHDGDVIHISAK